ncbi:MAG: 23S rRNA (adenine(2503)-C(2))-methyltransferase RlmN [Clostridia bacterium]
MEKIILNELTVEQLENYIEKLDEKKFHAKQIFKWLHRIGVTSFEEMSDISKSLREKLKSNTVINEMKVIKCQISKKDGTMKFLIGLNDNCAIESVLMRYNHGNTLCVSTQVGCKMGCKFCASTKDGFERSLTASEIEGQILTVQRYTKEIISNVVYMGIGEPLDNYENTVASIRLINYPLGLNIGARHISLSTCGIVPMISKLANENIQCTLSISLHATTDQKRKKIMPIANKYTIEQLLGACKEYIKITGRRISFEYALIEGQNDSYEDAIALVKLLRGMIAHVNLIPVNEIKEKEYKKSRENSVEKFMNTLNSCGIVTTVRRELGTDIDAACGQLRKKYIENSKNV